MLPRFFAPDLARSAADSLVALPQDEATHLARVLRLKAGDRVRVFNGQGGEWEGTVTQVGRQSAVIRLLEPVSPVPEPRIPIALVVAVLKSDKMDDVVRDAVMLGAAAIQPVVTERTELSLSTVSRSGRVGRWQRIAIASAKQCGRAVIPPVHDAVAFAEWLGRPAGGDRLMLVEPETGAGSALVDRLAPPGAAELIVGPDGGWTGPEMVAAKRAGAQLVTLGMRTLRADAVPIVALSALFTIWREF